MRFFEYESRQVVAKAGIPVSAHGFATTPAEARRIAEEIGAPTVIKSQVLTGGRMKAGGVQFADTPAEAEAHAEAVLALEINGHMPRGVLIGAKAEIKQEYYAGVIYDGIAKLPTFVFSDMGGIDIEEVAFAKKVIEAIPDGRGVHMVDGKMQDDATWKQCRVMVDLAEMLAAKDPELAEAYGMTGAGA